MQIETERRGGGTGSFVEHGTILKITLDLEICTAWFDLRNLRSLYGGHSVIDVSDHT